MIVISLLREPVEVDFSDLLPGVKMVLRRLTSMDFALARDRAESAVKSLGGGIATAHAYGLDSADAVGTHLNLTDAEMMLRIGGLVASVEIAMLAIESWSGITIEGGKTAAIERALLTQLLMEDAVETRLLAEVTRLARIVLLEKKDWPASQNGSATGDATGSAQNTVGDAPNSISPAAADRPDMVAGPAHKLN